MRSTGSRAPNGIAARSRGFKHPGSVPRSRRTAGNLCLSVSALLFLTALPTQVLADVPLCTGEDLTERQATCVIDGDSGFEAGRRWRLADINAPEIDRAKCRGEQRLALKARDRLRELMGDGYTIEQVERQDKFERDLVRIRLPDGRSAGDRLLKEGLAQPWPSPGYRWCARP